MNSYFHLLIFSAIFTLGGITTNKPARHTAEVQTVVPMDQDTTTELHMGEFPFFEGTLSAPVSLRDLNPNWLTDPNQENEPSTAKNKEYKPKPPMVIKQATTNDDQTEAVPLPTLWTYELLNADKPAMGGFLRTAEMPYDYLFYHDQGGLMLVKERSIEVKLNGVTSFTPTELIWLMETANLEKSGAGFYRISPKLHTNKSLMLDENNGLPVVVVNEPDTDTEKEQAETGKKKSQAKLEVAKKKTDWRFWTFSAPE